MVDHCISHVACCRPLAEASKWLLGFLPKVDHAICNKRMVQMLHRQRCYGGCQRPAHRKVPSPQAQTFGIFEWVSHPSSVYPPVWKRPSYLPSILWTGRIRFWTGKQNKMCAHASPDQSKSMKINKDTHILKSLQVPLQIGSLSNPASVVSTVAKNESTLSEFTRLTGSLHQTEVTKARKWFAKEFGTNQDLLVRFLCTWAELNPLWSGFLLNIFFQLCWSHSTQSERSKWIICSFFPVLVHIK